MTEVAGPDVVARRRQPDPAPRNATFGGITTGTGPPVTRTRVDRRVTGDRPDFAAIHASPEFTRLRARFRRFVFPMSALFLVWYLTYVLLAAYAKGFMSTRLWGAVNIGLVLGLLQFVSTIAITAWYVHWARRRIDPEVDAIRANAGLDKA